ncbi:alpha-galactosidase [Georgenia halophila]|uniref:Alpha-galactosidase n=1 Tax=Georgenia halophila TaxID=620889 RepID=A0ABP8LC76_9MICO
MTEPSRQTSWNDHLNLRAAGTSLVLDCAGDGLPRVLHWGTDLGRLTDEDVAQLRLAQQQSPRPSQTDTPVPLALLAEQSSGWMGTPGLTGHRAGTDFSTAFTVTAIEEVDTGPNVATAVTVTATDTDAGIDLALGIELLISGLVRMRAAVTNTGVGVFDLHSLDLNLPVPSEAEELLDLTGRWGRERAQQRHTFTQGTHLRESRRSRGLDAALIMAAGRRGFSWRSGELRAVHVAWSGNTRTYAERLNHGASTLAGGELLLAGEIRLDTDETYTGPWLYYSHGEGLDESASRFHRYLRSRPEHPTSTRPVQINVWEAVYFDHTLDKLKELADVAASLGVERYVLDDGWFGSRRDDTSGLGDWVVSRDVWPDGLGPIIDHVHGHGMEFGLWFEPEMVNPDSDVARAHPEWILAARPDRWPPEARHQQVLNLTIPEAYAHVRDQMLAILREYRIEYIKWDFNRDLIEAGTQSTGRAAVHQQTLAAYRLMDELLAAQPGLEIESCSSGGGRIDLGVMARCVRIWASDCNDPLERQLIEAGTSMLLPPEMVGSHVASPVSHTTGRAHTLDFRAGTSFFSHMGIEWDITSAEPEELDRLRQWIDTHKKHRQLLHSGDVVHGDHPDDAYWLHGVVAADAGEAIFAVAAVRSSPLNAPGAVRVPGLDPTRRYRVTPLVPGATGRRRRDGKTAWWEHGLTLPGRVLDRVGVQMPNLNPEQQVLLHLSSV